MGGASRRLSFMSDLKVRPPKAVEIRQRPNLVLHGCPARAGSVFRTDVLIASCPLPTKSSLRPRAAAPLARIKFLAGCLSRLHHRQGPYKDHAWGGGRRDRRPASGKLAGRGGAGRFCGDGSVILRGTRRERAPALPGFGVRPSRARARVAREGDRRTKTFPRGAGQAGWPNAGGRYEKGAVALVARNRRGRRDGARFGFERPRVRFLGGGRRVRRRCGGTGTSRPRGR